MRDLFQDVHSAGVTMRATIGTIVGLVIGLVGGFSLGRFGPIPTSEPHEQVTVLQESYLLCRSNIGGSELPLVIKSNARGGKEIIFKWTTDADRFRVDETSELNYIAERTEPAPRVQMSSMDLSRISGEMTITHRWSAEALKSIVAMCVNSATRNQCNAQMQALGGRENECFIVQWGERCPIWISGNNFVNRYQFTCRPSERRY